MEANSIVERQLAGVVTWLAEGGDAETMVRACWRLRKQWFADLATLPEVAQEVLGHIDVATDGYWADDDPCRDHGPEAIAEGELRMLLDNYINDLDTSAILPAMSRDIRRH